jgi:hypothetical protein
MSPFHPIACRHGPSTFHRLMGRRFATWTGKSTAHLPAQDPPPPPLPAFPSPPPAPKFPEFLPRERKNEAKNQINYPVPRRAARAFPPKTNLISARASDPGFLSSFHPSRRRSPTRNLPPPRDALRRGVRGKGAEMDAAKSVTPGAVTFVLANPSPKEADKVPELVVQVLDLKSLGATRFT